MPRSMAGIRDWVRKVPDAELLDPRTRHNATTGRALAPLLKGARAIEPLQRR